MKLSKSIDEYEKAKGWSSSLFYPHAAKFLKELEKKNAIVDVGRTVIYINDLKVYVHHNGRSKEYATVTDKRGNELFTAHYTEIEKLKEWILNYLEREK